MPAVSNRWNWDRIGAFASMACAVHCLLTGVALGLLSVAGLGFVGSLWADLAFIGFALLVGVTAIWHGYRKHHSLVPALVFCLSLGLIAMAFFAVGERTAWHTVFSVAGGLGLVSFHVLNLRFGHSCRGVCNCAGEAPADSHEERASLAASA
jgi:hypothetical protein